MIDVLASIEQTYSTGNKILLLMSSLSDSKQFQTENQ